MSRDEFAFPSGDGIEVAYYRWRAPGRAVGIGQIAHGMGEHALRYEPIAAFLNGAGFHVFANDHPGHGRTAKGPDSLGGFGEGGWNALVAEMVAVMKYARMREGKLPLVRLGQSMGSFAAQQYLLDNSEMIAAAVISGSAAIDMMPLDTSKEPDLT